eukprot:3659465-Prymnesium_polylepis.1
MPATNCIEAPRSHVPKSSGALMRGHGWSRAQPDGHPLTWWPTPSNLSPTCAQKDESAKRARRGAPEAALAVRH